MTLNSEQMERTDNKNLQHRKVSSGYDRDPGLEVINRSVCTNARIAQGAPQELGTRPTRSDSRFKPTVPEELCFLYLFSGPEDDDHNLRGHLQKLGATVAMVDILIDKVNGDLCDDKRLPHDLTAQIL